VLITNFAFSPASLTVPAGTTVVWTNQDTVTHTVTAADKSFDSGNLLPGRTYSRTFTTPGTYPYICQIHSFMTGTVTVT
jgi:plastocyanin